ncbi:MAG: DUF2911 domain-containing protein [Planctomycetes bacterium]|nr:DUF2911 domain-containing protein [Planctomycetota bacterium]
MRFPLLAATLATFCLAVPTTAQKVQVFGNQHGERGASTQILFGDGIAGGVSIEYGQPIWKDSYNAMLDQLKGKLNRLGKDWWTTMTTSFTLDIAGTVVPAGSYLVGLDCDKDGKFALALLEATKGLKHGALPFAMGKEGMNWKPDYLVPLQLKKDAAAEVVEKMTMTIDLTKGLEGGSYTLAWGKHELTASITVKVGKQSDDDDDDEGHGGGEHKGGDADHRRKK